MFKENGRYKPADPKEFAGISQGKEFECPHCGHIERHKNVEFGERKVCSRCQKGVLVEKPLETS